MSKKQKQIAIEELRCILNKLQEIQKESPLAMYPAKLYGPGCEQNRLTLREMLEGMGEDWRKVDIRNSDLVKQLCGMAIPQLLRQIKIAAVMIFLIFLVNFYTSITSKQGICNAKEDVTCKSYFFFKQEVLDFRIPNTVLTSEISYFLWICIGYSFRIENYYSQAKSASEQKAKYDKLSERKDIFLKDFKPGLTKIELEAIVQRKVTRYLEKRKFGKESIPTVRILEIKQVLNHSKYKVLLQNSNDLYTKIILLLQKRNYEEILKRSMSNTNDGGDSFDEGEEESNSVSINSSDSGFICIPLQPLSQVVEFSDELMARVLKGKNEKKFIKLLADYQLTKVKLSEEVALREQKKVSTSYVIQVGTSAEELLISCSFAEKRNFILRGYRKVRYFFQKNKNWLERAVSIRTIIGDMNWRAAGVKFQTKQKRRIWIRFLGILLFLTCSTFLSYIAIIVLIIDLDLSIYNSAFMKFLAQKIFALINTVLFLLCQKLYTVFSKRMAYTKKSDEFKSYFQDFFLFYSIAYIYGPLIGLAFCARFISMQQSTGNPFSNRAYSPFQAYLESVFIGILIFSAQACFPTKMLLGKLKQMWYLKRNRWEKLTQDQLNRIQRRIKYSFKQTTMLNYSLIIMSMIITYSMPILLIIPTLILVVTYFVLKYQFFCVYAPKYHSTLIHNLTSSKLNLHIVILNFFTQAIFIQEDDEGSFSLAILFLLVIFEVIWKIVTFMRKKLSKTDIQLNPEQIRSLLNKISEDRKGQQIQSSKENSSSNLQGGETYMTAYSNYLNSLNQNISVHI